MDRINDAMDEALLGHNHAKSALDLACWDLFGKSVGLPAHKLLGGATGNRLPAISSIYAGTPEDMRTRVAEHRTMGYIRRHRLLSTKKARLLRWASLGREVASVNLV